MKILIVDDHALFRSGMVHLLKALRPWPEVIESENLADAETTIAHDAAIDMVLLDLQLGDVEGVDSLVRLRSWQPDIPIVVLSGEQDPGVIYQCIDKGAMGFISKSSTHEELLAAIQIIVAGRIYLPPEIKAREYLGRPGGMPDDADLLASLSDRQRQVLGFLLQGKPNKTISTKLNISENTVKAHLSAIFRILGARNRTEAVYFAARAGVPIE